MRRRPLRHYTPRPPLTDVVISDNIVPPPHGRQDDATTDTTRFLGQGSLEGLRDVPGRGHVDLPGGPDDRRRGRQGGYWKADARHGTGCVRDRTTVPGECVPRRLRSATRR